MEPVAELLKPVYRAIREDSLQGDYLQVDETPIRYLDPDVKGKSRQGYLWTYSRPGGDVVFEWRISRSREGPEQFLKTFRGKLQTDGYAAVRHEVAETMVYYETSTIRQTCGSVRSSLTASARRVTSL